MILDVPAPPVYSERLRQLFLRNAFAAEWASATSAPPTAILGTGLGGQELQDELAGQLIELLRAGRPVGEMARTLQAQARLRLTRPAVDSRSSFARSLVAQPAVASLASAALFTDRPEQVFPVVEAYK